MNYHSVAPAGLPDPMGAFGRSLRVEEHLFRAQMGALARCFSIVPLETLLAQLIEGSLRPGQACVTFDDGYADNYEYAFPILQRLGIPATIFLTTEGVEDGKSLWWERLASHLHRRAGGTGFVGAVTTRQDPCSPQSCPFLLPRVHVGNWDEGRFIRCLDKMRNKGIGNKVRSLLKTGLPAPVIAAGRRVLAGLPSRQ